MIKLLMRQGTGGKRRSIKERMGAGGRWLGASFIRLLLPGAALLSEHRHQKLLSNSTTTARETKGIMGNVWFRDHDPFLYFIQYEQ